MYSKICIVVSLALVFGFQLSAQEDLTYKKPVIVKDVVISYVKTPNLEVDSNDEVAKKVSKDWKWLKIDVKYKTYDITKLKDESGFATAKKGVSDFTIEFSVATLVDKKSIGIFSGNVIYDYVALDGKEHYATAFIPPHVYQRSIYKDEYKYDRKDLESKKVLVKVVSSQGQMLSWGVTDGKKSFDRLKSQEATKLAAFLAKKMSTLARNLDFRGAVLGRNKTPWKYINFDDYEMIKE